MKRKKNHISNHKLHDQTYWEKLADKYFDAMTTEEEEAALKKYIAGLPEEDTSMDEVKAVMGYFSTGRKLSGPTRFQQRKNGHSFWYWSAAAACLSAAIFTGAEAYYRHNNYCIVYMNGKKYTDTEFVMQHMRASIREIGLNDTDRPTAGEQLNELFSCMNEEDVIVTKE